MTSWALFLVLAASLPSIPRAWRQSDVDSLELPLANPKYSPIHISEKEYYRIPPRVIYKSYPVYRPDREPAGYMDWLRRQEPEISFDPAQLKSRQDWIHAGALVFDAPTRIGELRDGKRETTNSCHIAHDHRPVNTMHGRRGAVQGSKSTRWLRKRR